MDFQNLTKQQRFELSHAAIDRAQVQLEEEQKADVVVNQPNAQDAQLIKEDLEDVLVSHDSKFKENEDIVEVDMDAFRENKKDEVYKSYELVEH